MSIIARPFQPDDADQYHDIMTVTYNNGVPTPVEDRKLPGQGTCVAAIDGRIGGAGKINDYVCTRGKATLRSAGIAGVAVNPAERRSGIGSVLISFMVRHAREQGFDVSSLYPFRQSFYEKFGYQTVGKRYAIQCPTPRLPKLKSDLSVRKIVPDNWELLQSSYESFAHARSGFHVRDEKRWREIIVGRNHPTVYAFGDPVESYAIVQHKFDFWESQKVAEIAWSTGRGHRALLDWFSGLGANKSQVEWSEPSDSPYLARYVDQGVEMKIHQPIMYRVLNVQNALSRLVPEDSGEFTIEVMDDLVPENRGPWRVAFSPKGVEVGKADKAELSMDIRMFTSAFMGDPGILDLARNELIEVRDRVALVNASRLMSALPVSCWDFF